MNTATTHPAETIEQRIQKISAELLGLTPAEVEPHKHFIDDLGADSLDCIELVMEVEDEFGIELPDEECEKAKTVQMLADLVRKYTAA
jgi:acyl carrier protein